MKAENLKKALREVADPKRAETSLRFFKTGPGQYGEGDLFSGVSVPEIRKIARRFRGIALSEVLKVLKSPIHEDRLAALIVLVDLYRCEKEHPEKQEKVVRAYLKHLHYVNNWDLVDSSAPQLLGNWLLTHDRAILYEQILSPRLWTRRVAMVATQELIAHGESKDALALAELLLNDEEDLLHKASGWMLREIGQKCSLTHLRAFLRKHASQMPRTMLRYSIEKLPPAERQKWRSV